MAPNNDGISQSDIPSASSCVHVNSSSSSSEKYSNSAGSHESSSVFGDTACGEPLSPQHLVLDFTPIEDIDNDYVQRKCCAFWNFLNSQTDLHDLMILPEQNTYNMTLGSKDSIKQDIETKNDETSLLFKEKTAVSMLEFVEGKGLIDRTFEARLPQSMCSLGSREYRENEISVGFKRDNHKGKVCKCRDCESCQTRQAAGAVLESSADVQLMCSKMTEWDQRHPKMIKLPDLRKDPKETADLCKCRPVCKSRRREWRGKIQNTSAELLLERKPLPECFRRCPTKVFPNSPCPLFGRSRRVTVNERNAVHTSHVVRVCQAPVDDTVDTPYLRFAEMAKKLGAWGAVKASCAFCRCGACCGCCACDYVPRDAERASRRRADMREFDSRVRTDYMRMRIMYDKP